MKDALLCGQVLDVESEVSKRIQNTVVVHRFPQWGCALLEKHQEDGQLRIYLVFSRFCKGTVRAMQQVNQKHEKLIANTEDARIVRILRPLGFTVAGRHANEYILKKG